ncbi:MAG: flagellar assembly protein FliW [Melioribacteraceae bacterium]|nr:flagellar assembly protein FliW [Melioribacteraceae bacterium]MCF8355164.1 flagellar assembly protein FliW [Melioribacteraceae bacterium]MCF8392493.1 flagellar assembly protein FliW [Melioribacteraceae bacterium]MCF8418404.1 flagellar assembly protein FliW [Melioribacteraceae bacterium]
MKINTKQFGTIEFDEEKVIKFESGLLGFEEYHDYLLITEENGYFYWLTSIDQPELVFPLFPIRLLEETYHEESSFEPFSIVTLDKNPANITVNLKAPVYLNQEAKTGFQKIIDDENYPVEYNLFTEN